MKSTQLHLGYEVGTGKPVTIPLRNMVVTGQTQEAGKTTALEALIRRSQLPAIAFITKRGEESFADGRRITPYFREQADWQFVSSVLEAAMGEKLKFERAWIMRASKGARTLADVQANVRKLMITAKGMSADVYLTLDSYLEIVVPRVARIRWAEKLDLAKGLNVLDLSDRETFPSELQALVMRSSLHWVYEKSNGAITIIPEAWEFLPQGRGSPVKLAAIELLRKGSGLRNYIWFDSQDIGGVDKQFLRSCPVWLLGVQRETNEIKRVLANIPAGVGRPKAEDVATLELGQFYACHGRAVVKTYVQPAWMEASQAKEIAVGTRAIGDVAAPRRKPPAAPALTPPEKSKGKPPMANNDLSEVLAGLDALKTALANHGLAPAIAPPAPVAPRSAAAVPAALNDDEEAVYQRFKARLLQEAPHLIKLLVERPEIELAIEVPTIEMDGTTVKGRVAALIHKDFFREIRRHVDVKNELERTGGAKIDNKTLSVALKSLVKLGFLTDEEKGYLAVTGMKVNLVKGAAKR